MNTKEINEGNELIAKFMDESFGEIISYHGIKGSYHKSWNELMPVIGKISNQCEEPEELDGLKYALLCDDIDTAWIFVVDYLTKFNIKN